jgi:hypothetical protein
MGLDSSPTTCSVEIANGRMEQKAHPATLWARSRHGDRCWNPIVKHCLRVYESSCSPGRGLFSLGVWSRLQADRDSLRRGSLDAWSRRTVTHVPALRHVARRGLSVLLPYILLGLAFAWSLAAQAQENGPPGNLDSALAGHLDAGEFGLAAEWAQRQTGVARDRALAALSAAQHRAGMSAAALETAAQLDDSQQRAAAFGQLTARPLGAAIARGGAAMADFDSLIDMITSTVAPDSWEEVGGPGAIERFPGGVLIDPAGLMDRIKAEVAVDPRWSDVRTAARRYAINTDVRRESPLRKISLNRLERQLQILAAARRQPDEVMQNLAGLNRLQYLLLYPESGEIVLAGPAGDWTEDAEGRRRSVSNGRPCLQLDDLLVVFRQTFAGDGRFGCSITPTREGLAQIQTFLQASAGKSLPPGRSAAWIRELGEQLGKQRITVSGIDPRTRTALTLVEADYHMKLVGLGLVESVLGVPSYLDQLQPEEASASMDVLRWWFTLNYHHLETTPARDVFALRGPAVQVLSENELLTLRGERVPTGKSDEKNQAFAQSFTEHFESLAAKYPVYSQLRNIFDLALMAEIARSEIARDRIAWRPETLLDEAQAPVALGIPPAWVASVLNHRFLDRSRFVVAVSGGVSVDARSAVTRATIRVDNRQKLPDASRHASTADLAVGRWWWD